MDVGRRKVDKSEGRLWAETRGFLSFETSAQTGENITEMFQVISGSLHMQMHYHLKNIPHTHTHTHTDVALIRCFHGDEG